jgi:hypothetical protein
VRVALDDEDRVPTPEQVPVAIVPLIEELRVATVHHPHAAGQLRPRSLNDQVVVVRHQAVRMAGPAIPSDNRAEQRQEGLPVSVVEENLAMIRASVGDVIDPVGKLASRMSWHASKLRADPVARQTLERTSHSQPL